jgi:nicotinamide-nucleotide amidase
MHIEIVSIGNELLTGRIVNTNAAFLCARLESEGYRVSLQTTLPDERALLLKGLQEALARSDLVIATGGLGPTLDDGTREVAAELFQSDFHVDIEIREELRERYPGRFFAVEDQARIPTKAMALRNRVGSAPGLLFSEGGKTLILLPGVPKEMEPLFLESVFPYIQKGFPVPSKHRVHLHFCLVFESLLDPHLRKLSSLYPAVEVGIYPAHGTLSVVLSSLEEGSLRAFERDLLLKFGEYRYEAASIAEALQAVCVAQGKTLACAESCTGGMLASCVTAVAGSSAYFLGSLVTYSNGMKHSLLGVSEAALASQGAVSAEVVQEMLLGVFRCTEADYAIAVSGIAGPSGGSPDKPVGTVFAAIGERGKAPDVGVFKVFGNRQTRILTSSQYLLGALWRKIAKGIPAFPLVDM